MSNHIHAVGLVINQPDFRTTKNNHSVCIFAFQLNAERKGKESPHILQIKCWDKLAEKANRLLNKNDKVYLHGRLKQEHWGDQAVRHSRDVIIAQSIERLAFSETNGFTHEEALSQSTHLSEGGTDETNRDE